MEAHTSEQICKFSVCEFSRACKAVPFCMQSLQSSQVITADTCTAEVYESIAASTQTRKLHTSCVSRVVLPISSVFSRLFASA